MSDLEMLKMAHYKMGEMLNLGSFDDGHFANIERAMEKIKAHINEAESKKQ